MLRAAPAVGALLMTVVLARHAIHRRVGMRMFQTVITVGLATVVFAHQFAEKGEHSGFWRRQQGIWGDKTCFHGMRIAITV